MQSNDRMKVASLEENPEHPPEFLPFILDEEEDDLEEDE
jgi:hypothetical protein